MNELSIKAISELILFSANSMVSDEREFARISGNGNFREKVSSTIVVNHIEINFIFQLYLLLDFCTKFPS